MKLLFVLTPDYDPHKGGVQRSTYKLANYFKKNGLEVTVLCLREGKNRVVNEVKVQYLNNQENYDSHKNKNFLESFLKKRHFDIIINQMGYDYSLTKLINSFKNSDTKLINTIRINPIHFLQNYKTKILQKFQPSFYYDNSLFWWLLRKYHIVKQKFVFHSLFKYSDKIVLLSSKFITEVEFFYSNFPKEKLTAIPNPFENPHFDNNKKKKDVVLFVGRLNFEQKRVDLLVKIFEKLARKKPGWEYWIVGDGPKKEFLLNKIEKIDADNIRFFGYQDPDPYYQKAKILAFTSAYEGFGNVLVEAQFFGVVPVLFDSYSNASEIVIHNKSGVLIEKFDVDKYTKSVVGLMNDENRLQKMSSQAIENAKRYEIGNVGKKWLDLFKELRN